MKYDSCWASNDHETAFVEYAAMRDALNSTGRPVLYSLCGWNAWYATEANMPHSAYATTSRMAMPTSSFLAGVVIKY